MRRLVACVTAWLGALVCAACRSVEPSVVSTDRGPWTVSEVPTGTGVLVAAASVELDAEGEGREVVAVGEDGAIVLLRRGADGLAVETIAQLSYAAHAIGVGELDAAHAGPELVVLTGAALDASPSDSPSGVGPGGEPLTFRGRAWLCVREAAPAIAPGAETVIAPGAKARAVPSAPRFVARELWAVPERIEALLVADLDPGAVGDEVLLAEGEGRLTLLTRGAEGETVAAPWSCRGPAGALDLAAYGPIRTLTRTPAGILVGFEDGALHEFERPPTAPGIRNAGDSAPSWLLRRSTHQGAPVTSVAVRDSEWLVADGAGGVRLYASAASGAVERTTQLRAADRAFCTSPQILSDPWGFGSSAALAAVGDAAATAKDGPLYVFASGPAGMLRVLRLLSWPVADALAPPTAELASYEVEEQHLCTAKGALHALVAGPVCGRDPACVAVGPSGSLFFAEHREPEHR